MWPYQRVFWSDLYAKCRTRAICDHTKGSSDLFYVVLTPQGDAKCRTIAICGHTKRSSDLLYVVLTPQGDAKCRQIAICGHTKESSDLIYLKMVIWPVIPKRYSEMSSQSFDLWSVHMQGLYKSWNRAVQTILKLPYDSYRYLLPPLLLKMSSLEVQLMWRFVRMCTTMCIQV